MTDATTGLLLLPARSYDPAQGRFISRDTANVFNHYQGFSTNPIVLVDLTGHFSLADLLIDIGTAIMFGLAAVLTGGAALAAAPAIVAAEAAVTTSTIVATVAGAVTAVASATGFVASAVKAADDIDDAVSRKHFLSNDQRSALGTVELAAGVVAAATGLVFAGASAAGAIAEGAESATQDAAAIFQDPKVSDVESSWSSEDPMPGETIFQDPKVSDVESSWSSTDDQSSNDNLVDGVSGRAAEPQPVTPSASRPIPIQRPVLRTVLGSGDLNATDSAVITSDRGLTASLNTDEAAFQSRIASLVPRATGTYPILTAMNGNWDVEAALNAMLNRGQAKLIATLLNRDDNFTFMQFPPSS
jgi:hypothetical protein